MLFFETVGSEIGNYIGSLYGAYVVNFLLPLFTTAPLFWAAYRYLKPLPEPDYRRPLLAIAGGQLLYFALFSLLWPIPPAGLLIVVPLALALLAGILWVYFRPGRGSVSFLGLCELFTLALIAYGLVLSRTGYATAAMLGALVPVLGGLLWVTVGLRYQRIRAGNGAA
jgi:hypothetical protein